MLNLAQTMNLSPLFTERIPVILSAVDCSNCARMQGGKVPFDRKKLLIMNKIMVSIRKDTPHTHTLFVNLYGDICWGNWNICQSHYYQMYCCFIYFKIFLWSCRWHFLSCKSFNVIVCWLINLKKEEKNLKNLTCVDWLEKYSSEMCLPMWCNAISGENVVL